MMGIAEQLMSSYLFEGIDEYTLDDVSTRFMPQRFISGEVIVREGERGDGFYVIVSGEVAVRKGQGISQRELKRLGAGHCFGEMALIVNEPRGATVRSVTETDVLFLRREDFVVLMDEYAVFAQRILKMISMRLRQSNELATQDLIMAHQGLIISLAQLAESRDTDTGNHIYRVRDYCTLLARLMAEVLLFADTVTQGFIEAIYCVAPLHDIGKVGIPDSILKKPGKLTAEEYEIIKTHPAIGAASIDTVLQFCDLGMFRMARELTLGHHERYDGAGYPQGLKGKNIPLEARIMALADYYDAMLSKRYYKAAMPHADVIELIKGESGKIFDPAIVDIMMDNHEQFRIICEAYASGYEPETPHSSLGEAG